MKKITLLLASILLFLSVVSTKAAPATLQDYWDGSAVWTPAFTIDTTADAWKTGFGGSGQMIVMGDTWYFFDRHVDPSPKPEYCPQNKQTLEVRKSTDSGKTWSSPIDVLTNTRGTPEACYAVDGGVYYQASTQTWHLLYQCWISTIGWAGCYATRQGEDPMGPFTPDPQNPVIKPSSLWSKICNSPTDRCVSESTGSIKPPVDEGTFDIFNFDGHYYWVSFHGYDGIDGFRGIAKTTDFHTYIAGDTSQGVPQDAIFSPSDGNAWNVNWVGGSIGGGAGRIIQDGGYWYLLVEAADGNLGGTSAQNWVWGILRSTSLASSAWSQPSSFKNPVLPTNVCLRAVDHPAFSLGYAGVFKDQAGQYYLHATRSGYKPEDSGLFFYKLVSGTPQSMYSNPSIEDCRNVLLYGQSFRGGFILSGQAQTTNGATLNAGNYLQITDTPGGGNDWLLNAPDSGQPQCPNGYHSLGSFAPFELVDYQGVNKSYHWGVFCGKTDDVVLATTCPSGYESKGWFDAPNQSNNAAYDYLGNEAGGQRLNFCSKATLAPTPTPSPPSGDINGDGIVDYTDYNILVSEFGKTGSPGFTASDLNGNGKVDIFDYNIIVTNFEGTAPGSTPTPSTNQGIVDHWDSTQGDVCFTDNRDRDRCVKAINGVNIYGFNFGAGPVNVNISDTQGHTFQGTSDVTKHGGFDVAWVSVDNLKAVGFPYTGGYNGSTVYVPEDFSSWTVSISY